MGAQQTILFLDEARERKDAKKKKHEKEKMDKKEMIISMAKGKNPNLPAFLLTAGYPIYDLMTDEEKNEVWKNISHKTDFLIELVQKNHADVFPNKAFSLYFLSRFWNKLTDAESVFLVKSQYYRDGMKKFLSSEKYRGTITEKIGKELYKEAVKSIGE